MGEAKAIADLLHDRQLVRGRLEDSLLDEVPEVGPLEQLHGHVDDALEFAEVEDGDDVRVRELARVLGLALEALAVAVVREQGLGDRLDGDEAVENGVVALKTSPIAPSPILARMLYLPIRTRSGFSFSEDKGGRRSPPRRS